MMSLEQKFGNAQIFMKSAIFVALQDILLFLG
jgi:hypothetical protein